MACTIDFTFLTGSCKPDLGELQTALEALCDLATDAVVPTDPNSGGCGQWGADSVIDAFTFDSVTRALTLDAVPEWTAINFDDFASQTYDPTPTDISAVAAYPGVQLVVTINNPSNCRSLVFYGNFIMGNVISYSDNAHIITELRDVTGGAPGTVIGDQQRQRIGPGAGDVDYFEMIIPVNFVQTIAPAGSFSATYQTYINTITATGTATPSEWHQTNLAFTGIGALV